MEFIKPVPYCSPTLLQWIPFYYNSQFDYIESNCHSSFFFFPLPLSVFLPSVYWMTPYQTSRISWWNPHYSHMEINCRILGLYFKGLSAYLSWYSLSTKTVFVKFPSNYSLAIHISTDFQNAITMSPAHDTHRHTHDQGNTRKLHFILQLFNI